MGFSSTVGVIIIISTLLFCSIYLYTTLDLNMNKVSKAYSDYIELKNKKLREKLVIVSVKGSSNSINITVENNGSVVLEPSKWTVLYNGTPISFSIHPNVKYLLPLSNTTICINATTPARLCIISEHGVKYYYYIE